MSHSEYRSRAVVMYDDDNDDAAKRRRTVKKWSKEEVSVIGATVVKLSGLPPHSGLRTT